MNCRNIGSSFGNPWEFERPEVYYRIGFGGFVEYIGRDGDIARGIWHPGRHACRRWPMTRR